LDPFAPLRLAPWNTSSTENISVSPWNTDSTKIQFFDRSDIPQGEVSFLSNRKYWFRFDGGQPTNLDLTSSSKYRIQDLTTGIFPAGL